MGWWVLPAQYPAMEIVKTGIQGALVWKPRVLQDSRGFFFESWNEKISVELGVSCEFVQDNHSRSARHVLRGLHYQTGDEAQGKLVWVTQGEVFDVVVDLRRHSPTFGCWEGHLLDGVQHSRLWVPPGCAHGFLVLSEWADFQYKCTRPYNPSAERALRWDDPTLAISWPLPSDISPLLSPKDAAAPGFDECEKYE
jgi:dTDP-4-dehydrorhamnose 3,5-epimerase